MAAESLVQMLEEIAVGLKAGDEEIYGWLREQGAQHIAHVRQARGLAFARRRIRRQHHRVVVECRGEERHLALALGRDDRFAQARELSDVCVCHARERIVP